MSQVVQAKCPHCQNVLRIPSEWVDKAMRCKNCKQTFQAKTSSNVAAGAPKAQANYPVAQPAKPKPAPIAKPANAIPVGIAAGSPPPSAGNLFGFDEESSTPSIARRRSGGRGMFLMVVMFFFLFMIAAGAAGFVVYKAMNNEPLGGDTLQALVKGDVKKGESNPVRPPTDGSNDKKKSSNDDKDKDKVKDMTPIEAPPPKKEPPPKKNPPKKEPPKKDPEIVKNDPPKKPLFTNDPFPRRALLVSVNNYIYYNTVHYGSETDSFRKGYPGSSTGVLRDRLSRAPMNFPATQIVELSDGIPPGPGAKPHSTQKSVIESTIKDFVEGCREQDRVFILFAGHAASVEDKAYLVPSDGDIKDAGSLVPLKWVYDQLSACKAQQKILVLDVFRYSPSRGADIMLTGDGDEGRMPESFDKELLSPPSGVQVWSACSKHQDKDNKGEFNYQNSVELEGGSAFLQALCNALQPGAEMKGISNATQPIPIDALVKDVNERLTTLLAPYKDRTQVSRLSGKASDKVIEYNKDEPLPVALKLKPPTAGGAMAASKEDVNSILDFFRELPQVRETRAGDANLLNAGGLPAFAAKKLESYKPDALKDFADLQRRFKTDKDEFTKEYPLRAAIVDAVEALQESNKLRPREVLSKADTDPKRKAAMRLEQEPLGMSTFQLERVLVRLKTAGEMRDMETSRRWQANYDYTQARLQSRLIYLIEYNYLLGRVLADDVPDLEPGQTGWRIGAGKKIAVTEKKAKDLAKDTKKLWERIAKDYPDTPWSLLASREKDIALGLQWRPKSD